jgi:hypothetical protein
MPKKKKKKKTKEEKKKYIHWSELPYSILRKVVGFLQVAA